MPFGLVALHQAYMLATSSFLCLKTDKLVINTNLSFVVISKETVWLWHDKNCLLSVFWMCVDIIILFYVILYLNDFG